MDLKNKSGINNKKKKEKKSVVKYIKGFLKL